MLSKLLLLAQQDFQFDFGPQQPDAVAGGMLAAILFVLLIFLLVGLVVYIIVCYLLFNCFQRIPAQHRQMEPWQAWLLVIPLFNIVWAFFVFPGLARSYQSYFAQQGRTDVGDCGEKIGLWFAICFVANHIPCLNYVAAPACLVLLIIFLVKALNLKGQIPEGAI